MVLGQKEWSGKSLGLAGYGYVEKMGFTFIDCSDFTALSQAIIQGAIAVYLGSRAC